MRPIVLVLAGCLLLVAGCEEGSGSGSWTPEPEAAQIPGTLGTVSASFQPGGLADVIVVRTVDRLPMRSATLAGPGDQRIPAYSLDVEPAPIGSTSPAQLMLMNTPGATRSVTQVDTMVSTALIQLPNPVVYGRTWHDWRVLVRLGEPGGAGREMTLAAPSPPPPVPGSVPNMPSTAPQPLQ